MDQNSKADFAPHSYSIIIQEFSNNKMGSVVSQKKKRAVLEREREREREHNIGHMVYFDSIFFFEN